MSANPPKPKLFLSHNNRDKDHVRPLAAALQIAGGQVWFDEWTLRPGDSVPGGISEGLANFDVFVLVWSQNAAQSRWVTAELNAALVQQIEGCSRRIVPVLLDPTPLPALIGHHRYLDAPAMGHLEVARNLLGIESQRLLRKAIQSFIFEADLSFREYWGVGVLVACPQCGATLDRIRGFESIDDARDEVCRGAECLDCGWSDGSDV